MKMNSSFITNNREEALALVKQFKNNTSIAGESPTERQLSTSSTTITGYPAKIHREDYENMFKRTIGGSVINKKAEDTWREWFTVETEMEGLAREIEVMNKNLQAWRVFRLADIFARLDGYSIIFMGIRDGKKISETLETAQGIEYLKAYRKYQIVKVVLDTNKESQTYGEPINIIIRIGSTEKIIHISRILVLCEEHLGDPFSDSIPALERAYDYIQSLENLAWASSEGAFQRVVPPWHVKFEERPDSDVESDIDNQLDNFRTGVRQRIKTAGVTIEPLVGSGQMVPVDKIETMLIRLISSSVDIPQRMLFGSEAGALSAASEDVRAYYAGISARQENYAEPVMRTFFNRLQSAGVLPDGEFSIKWNPLFEMSEQEKNLIEKNIGIDLANRSRTAWLLSGSGQYEPLLSKEVILEKILGWTPEDTQRAMSNLNINSDRKNIEKYQRWIYYYLNTTSMQKEQQIIIKNFFIEQGKRIAKEFKVTNKININKSEGELFQGIQEIVSSDNEKLKGILRKMITGAYIVGHKKGRNELNLLEIPITTEVENILKQRSIRSAGSINKTTIDNVRKVMVKGVSKGEGINDIAKRISTVFKDAGKKRSELIARTEVIGSSNEGRFNAYRESNIVEKKEWIDTGDARVRPSHQIGGEIVGIDEAFSNGLQHPGDYSASSAEIVNCRCAIAPVIMEAES